MEHKIQFKKPAGIFQWLSIYRLYRSAFPDTERKPFSIIRSMYRTGKTDVWYCSQNGKFLGFAATINGTELILIDYFAVVPSLRQKGYGTSILRALMHHYKGKGVFVEIESMYEPCDDLETRRRRRQFYISCGMKPMNVMADVFGTKMELLGKDCVIDFDTYHTFYATQYSEMAARHIKKAYHPEA